MRLFKNAALAMLLAVVALLGVTVTVPAQAATGSVPSVACGAPDTGATYGWVTSPVNSQTVGSKHCRPMTLAVLQLAGGVQYAYWFTSHVNGAQIPTSNNEPNLGGAAGSAGRAHAEAAWELGDRWGVTVHFARYVGHSDREGYMYADGVFGLAGAYYTSPAFPGRGLIEISNGGRPLGLADPVRGTAYMRQAILDTVRHEIAHARIERWCGTTRPPIAGDRHENVTDAYAATFLGMTKGSYGYTAQDVAAARSIAGGDCG